MENKKEIIQQQPEQPIIDHVDILLEGIELHWLGGSASAPIYKLYYSIDGTKDEKTIHETNYLIRIKKWKIINFGVQAKVGNLLSNITTLEFTNKNNFRKEFIIATLILVGVAVFGYLIGLGK